MKTFNIDKFNLINTNPLTKEYLKKWATQTKTSFENIELIVNDIVINPDKYLDAEDKTLRIIANSIIQVNQSDIPL